jgi:protein TonB
MKKFTLKIIFVFGLFLTVGDSLYGQAETEEQVYVTPDLKPEFPGGEDAMQKFFAENVRYPESAASAKLEGKVYVEFKVLKDGSLTDVITVKGVSDDCNTEAQRVVRIMPKWNPAKIDNKVVEQRVVVRIAFADKKE